MNCFLCGNSTNVLKFTDDKLKQCHQILKYRVIKQFKYSDIIVPQDADSNVGYHSACLKKFIILKAQYRQELNEMFGNIHVSIITSLSVFNDYNTLIIFIYSIVVNKTFLN